MRLPMLCERVRCTLPAAQASVRSLDRCHAAALGCPAFHDACMRKNCQLASVLLLAALDFFKRGSPLALHRNKKAGALKAN